MNRIIKTNRVFQTLIKSICVAAAMVAPWVAMAGGNSNLVARIVASSGRAMSNNSRSPSKRILNPYLQNGHKIYRSRAQTASLPQMNSRPSIGIYLGAGAGLGTSLYWLSNYSNGRANSEEERNFVLDAENGDLEKVELALKSGISVNIQGSYGDTALIAAARFGYTRLVEVLIQHGADINITNNIGFTALMMAVMMSGWYETADVVRVLLEHNPRLDLKGFPSSSVGPGFHDQFVGLNVLQIAKKVIKLKEAEFKEMVELYPEAQGHSDCHTVLSLLKAETARRVETSYESSLFPFFDY